MRIAHDLRPIRECHRVRLGRPSRRRVRVLRLNFLTLRGDSPTLMIATCVRFAADGTLRGPDNYVIARCLDGAWQVGGRMHRELECDGPVRVRLLLGTSDPPRVLGTFRQVRTRGGMLYGDDACLHVSMPGRCSHPAGPAANFSVTFERGPNAEA